jgi:pimeloyl-ACP methyl ester carboxylesterase
MERIRSQDGTLIAAWHSGVGAPLLLVHGTTGDHTVWTSVRAALERHFTVWTLDRRGRGSSGDAAAYALEREGEDIAAVIDAIGGTVHVLGQSFGGLCALEAALLTPHLGRLILYEPTTVFGHRNWPGADGAHLQALLDAGHSEEALLFFLGDIVKIPPPELAAMQAEPHWPGRVAAAHTIPRELREIHRYTFDPLRFRTLRTPTLLLVGGESLPHRLTITETLHQALSNSQIVVLQGQHHTAIRTAPDLVVQKVVTFFTETTSC